MFCICVLTTLVQIGAAVVQDQLEADGDASLQQRMLMGAGTTLGGASEMMDNEVLAGMSMAYMEC